jgi:hypothetical protein
MYSMIISTKSPSLCVCLTNAAALILKSHDCGSYLCGPILTLPPLLIHKLAYLRVSDFGHSPDWRQQPRLTNFTYALNWRVYWINPAIKC